MTQISEFVGIDVGKDEFFVFSTQHGDLGCFANTALGIAECVDRLSAMNSRAVIALEPTGGYEWALWQALHEAGFDARQVPASQVRFYARACGRLAKTDKIDAEIIAGFIAVRLGSGRKPPQKIIRYINILSQKRRQLVAHRKSLRIQIQQEKTDAFSEDNQDLLNVFDAQIEALEAKIAQAIAADQSAARRAEILRSIPGVGPVLCAVLIGQMPELGTCNDRQIAALAGVAPMDHQSGRKDAKRRIYGGRADIRTVLYQAALVASIHNPQLKKFADRLKNAGKPHKVVMIAVARKLLTIANTLLAKNVSWMNI